jgi:alkanesulfonate monooxygenase SsuD/methylene tetrahydromethanopterin reductase-like flavin-dependent oxidoreductase (luciferase family)
VGEKKKQTQQDLYSQKLGIKGIFYLLEDWNTMKFGFIIPNGSSKQIVKLAVEAEKAGWDGVFYYDDIYTDSKTEMSAAWPIMAAIAVSTKRIKFGSLLTAVGRRHPWEVARESVTVDQLSNGRLILPTGLGWVGDGAYTKAGMESDRKIRAELLDEGLEIIDGLWSGKPFRYNGKHNHLKTMTFIPRPVQKPRIPIWVVGGWGRPKSMARVLKYDGLIPVIKKPDGSHEEITPEKIREMKEFVSENRKAQGNRKREFDIIMDGVTPTSQREARKVVEPFAEAGATWWTEVMWGVKKYVKVLKRILAGPPVLS